MKGGPNRNQGRRSLAGDLSGSSPELRASVPPALLDQVRQAAAKSGMAVSAWVRAVIEKQIKGETK